MYKGLKWEANIFVLSCGTWMQYERLGSLRCVQTKCLPTGWFLLSVSIRLKQTHQPLSDLSLLFHISLYSWIEVRKPRLGTNLSFNLSWNIFSLHGHFFTSVHFNSFFVLSCLCIDFIYNRTASKILLMFSLNPPWERDLHLFPHLLFLNSFLNHYWRKTDCTRAV